MTIVERFGIDKASKIPAEAGVKPLSKEGGSKSPEEEEETQRFR